MTTDITQHRTGRVAARRALVVLAAVAAALVLWTVTDPVAGADLAVRTGDDSVTAVGAPAVVGASLLAGLAGWALLAVLARTSRYARGIWTVVALAVLALSLLGPLGSGVGTTSRLVLAGLHLTVGAILVLGLRRTAPGTAETAGMSRT